MVKESIKLREAYVAAADEVARTTVGRILEVVAFKHQKEKMSGPTPAAQVEAFYKGVKLAAASEPVNFHFVDKALTVYEAVMSDDANHMVIFDLEERFGA